MTTHLDRLNELLKDPALKLPAFRQEVPPSFGNLKWLQDKLPKNADCTDELKALLKMAPKALLNKRTL